MCVIYSSVLLFHFRHFKRISVSQFRVSRHDQIVQLAPQRKHYKKIVFVKVKKKKKKMDRLLTESAWKFCWKCKYSLSYRKRMHCILLRPLFLLFDTHVLCHVDQRGLHSFLLIYSRPHTHITTFWHWIVAHSVIECLSLLNIKQARWWQRRGPFEWRPSCSTSNHYIMWISWE